MAVRSAALALGVSGLVLLIAGCATPTAIPPAATDAEVDEVVQQALAGYWSSLGPEQRRNVPPIQRISFTTTQSWSSAQVSCLLAAGLPAREVNGGFAVDGYGELTVSQGIDAQVICMGQYPVDPRTQGYLSDAQVLYMYDYFVERLVPCIELLGYEVAPPPDRYAYIGSMRSGFAWTPYGGTREARDWRWDLINAKCPPLPDDPYENYQPPAAG